MPSDKLSINYPEFYQNPNVRTNIDLLSRVGRGLLTGGMVGVGEEAGLLSFLQPLTSLNPEMTQKAIGLASRPTIEAQQRAQQDMINQLEANNQLTSSVTGNALADLNKSFSQDIADISTRFSLADEERAMSNIYNLFMAGSPMVQSATSLGLQEGQQQNEWNLEKAATEMYLQWANQPIGEWWQIPLEMMQGAAEGYNSGGQNGGGLMGAAFGSVGGLATGTENTFRRNYQGASGGYNFSGFRGRTPGQGITTGQTPSTWQTNQGGFGRTTWMPYSNAFGQGLGYESQGMQMSGYFPS